MFAKKSPLRGALLAAGMSLLIPSAAIAQPADAPPPADPGAAPETPDDLAGAVEDEEGEVIVITGSTIARRQTTTPAPVAIMDKEELDASGMVSIGEVLQNLPAQSNAINVQFNNGGDGSTRISLRGLGAGRTLVLVNGRRHVPGGTGANASVDLNAIPIAIIERVEVLKDGASAVYGSDAIGGVVNIITRQDFEGTEANIYTGTTQDGGGTVYDLSFVTGIKSDKGSFLFSGGYYDQGQIMAGQRDYSQLDKFYDFECVADGQLNGGPGTATLYHPTNNPDGCIYPNGSTATPEGTLIDQTGLAGNAAWDALLAGPCQTGACFNDPNGGFRDMSFDGNSDDGTGDLYNYQPENYVLTPQRRWNVYSQGRYHFHDKVDGYFESSYTKRKSDQLLAPEPLFIISEGLAVDANNLYNPYGRPFFDIRRRMVESGPRNFLQDIDTFRLVGGVQGDFPEAFPLKQWKWDANYNFGRTAGTDINEGNLVRSRVAQAIGPSFRDANGVPTCGTPAAPIPDCVPLNLFGGPGTITPEMLKYIQYTGIARGFTQQQGAQASANGKVADIGDSGDVRLAFGGEYRDLRGAYLPNPLVASGDTTGNKTEPTGGKYNVTSGYGELSIVPISGQPFADWVEITAAARMVKYNTFGSNLSWKTGVMYRLPQGISVRGTYSTAFRAPSIAEMFSGTYDSFPAVTDPCDTSMGSPSATVAANCAAQGIPSTHTDSRTQLKSRIGGNPDLDPEKAKIFTAGLVVEPKQVKGLAFTLDFWSVKLEDAITTVGAGIILSNCYERGLQEACDLVVRDTNTNLITEIVDTGTNIGGTDAQGVDFQVRYDTVHEQAGRLRANLEGTILTNYDIELPSGGPHIEGVGVYDLGVFPRLRANLGLLWGKNDFGAGWNVRYIGGFTECNNDDCDNTQKPDLQPGETEADRDLRLAETRDVSANVTMDFFGTYTLKNPTGTTKVTAGVNNLLNQAPPLIYNGFLATSDAATYDFMGRYFYLRLTQAF